MAPTPSIALIDLREQLKRIRSRVDWAIETVLDHGQFIMGPEVRQLEEELASFSRARHAISCGNGTDALLMVMMAKGIGPGDAVICPAFTFTATPEAVAITGAVPVFADVLSSTYNIDPAGVPRALETARRKRLRPKAILAVGLFGQPPDYDPLHQLAAAEDLWILDDAAQSFGASYKGSPVGTLALATTTSFFPAKPLGCLGDGGAVFTDDDDLAEALRSIRVHGKGLHKYDNVRIGLNSRLDTIQAAILIEKLRIFRRELEKRSEVASIYDRLIHSGVVEKPSLTAGVTSSWAQYTVRVKGQLRDALQRHLAKEGIETAVYYPRPLHQQTAYSDFPVSKGGVPTAESLCAEVISLPMHPYLNIDAQEKIADAVNTFDGSYSSSTGAGPAPARVRYPRSFRGCT